jgi:ppGpp synthetase/RelA/SpoT-type nucleotidyltranferase
MDADSIDANVQSYERLLPTYESFAGKVGDLLRELLKDAGISVQLVDQRAKKVSSFREKVERKPYKDPLTEITDLCGTRIVAYYREDIPLIDKLIRAEFDIDEELSRNTEDELEPNQFGYLSTHRIGRLSMSRRALAEYRSFADLRFEVQIRTALQHAWAVVSHKIDYKSPNHAPAPLRRNLFRLSALFELADEQFSLLREESRTISAAYTTQIAQHNYALNVDAASLEAYLAARNFAAELAGVDRSELTQLSASRIDNPTESTRQENRKDLLGLLQALGVESIQQLDQLLATADLERDIRLLDAEMAAQRITPSSVEDLLAALVVMRLPQPHEQASSLVPEYWERYGAAADSARRRLAEPGQNVA